MLWTGRVLWTIFVLFMVMDVSMNLFRYGSYEAKNFNTEGKRLTRLHHMNEASRHWLSGVPPKRMIFDPCFSITASMAAIALVVR